MNKIKIKFRAKSDSGIWCSLLLPINLFINFFKFPSEISFIMFFLSSCLLVVVCENQICIKTCDIFPPVPVKISYIITSSVFALVLFIKESSLNIYSLFIISYVAIWLFNYSLYSFLTKCPGSFTFGEAIIVAQGISLVIGGCLSTWTMKMFTMNYEFHDIPNIDKFLQILLCGCLLLLWTLNRIENLRTTIKFYGTCLILGSLMYLCWVFTLQNDPFLWIFTICLENSKRKILMFYWTIFSVASILFVVILNSTGKSKTSSSARKYFHVIINLIYLPGIFIDSELLYLASSVTFGIFIVLEIMRLLEIPPLGESIHNAFQIFLDEKDSGLLILTHIYLLVGCSCPFWLHAGKFDNSSFQVPLTSGLISVGAGDTMAAVFGMRFGKHKWPNSKKSIEGTVAAIIIQIIIGMPLLHLCQSQHLTNYFILFLGIFVTSIIEAKTNQIDNLVLPLVMRPFLCLVS